MFVPFLFIEIYPQEVYTKESYLLIYVIARTRIIILSSPLKICFPSSVKIGTHKNIQLKNVNSLYIVSFFGRHGDVMSLLIILA